MESKKISPLEFESLCGAKALYISHAPELSSISAPVVVAIFHAFSRLPISSYCPPPQLFLKPIAPVEQSSVNGRWELGKTFLNSLPSKVRF